LKLPLLERARAGLQLRRQYPLLWYWLIRQISAEEWIEDSGQYHGPRKKARIWRRLGVQGAMVQEQNLVKMKEKFGNINKNGRGAPDGFKLGAFKEAMTLLKNVSGNPGG
jgi:hypothetical protein